MKLAVKTRYIFSDFSDGDITDEYAVSNKSLSGAAVNLDLKISQTNHIEDLLDTSEECTNKEQTHLCYIRLYTFLLRSD